MGGYINAKGNLVGRGPSNYSMGMKSEERIRDGFAGQVMHVVPRPALQRAQQHPLVFPLHVTDIGFFPCAGHHYIERPHGTPQHILMICVEGRGWVKIGNERLLLQPNDAVFIPCHTAHSYGADDEDPWTIYWAHFVGDDADYFLGRLGAQQYVIPVDEDIVASLQHPFAEAFAVLAQDYTLPRLIHVAQLLRHVLSLLLYANRSFTPGMHTTRYRSLERAITYMRERLDQPLRVQDIALQAGLSVAQFTTLFRQLTGHSPIDYFIHLRVRHACHLLDTTDMTVQEVCWALGYNDPYYFSRAFKKVMGLSPKAYRALIKG